MRSSKPITVTLGRQQALVDEKLASGEYESASEVIRAGLRALERENRVVDEVMRQKIRESLDDPRPDIPAEDVFATIRELHVRQAKPAG